jgi:hypothetical protein
VARPRLCRICRRTQRTLQLFSDGRATRATFPLWEDFVNTLRPAKRPWQWYAPYNRAYTGRNTCGSSQRARHSPQYVHQRRRSAVAWCCEFIARLLPITHGPLTAKPISPSPNSAQFPSSFTSVTPCHHHTHNTSSTHPLTASQLRQHHYSTSLHHHLHRDTSTRVVKSNLHVAGTTHHSENACAPSQRRHDVRRHIHYHTS